MKVYKVIVDKIPTCCLFCPLKSSGVKIEGLECGKTKTEKGEDGWEQTYQAPDERCKFTTQ